MSEYLHGAYGQIQSVAARVADISLQAMVYVGTAPVHTLGPGNSYKVNKPVVVRNIAEARAAFGYSEDWASYTLCEAMHVHLEQRGVGPLILINVLDPAKAAHKSASTVQTSVTPVNGRIVINSAEAIINQSMLLYTAGGDQEDPPVPLVRGTDWEAAYDIDRKQITISELTSGALGTDALSLTYYTVKPEGVTAADVIGQSDGLGQNTGIHAVRSVYPETGLIPSYLLAPGFSDLPTVNEALIANSRKIGGHWDAYIFADLPISYEVSGNPTVLTIDNAAAWKAANGYTAGNETVFYPRAIGTDGKTYHISVLAAAAFQTLLNENSGIPYKTASSTPCGIIQGLYVSSAYRVFDDEIINRCLNQNGIASAAFVGGQWVIWGCHSADYNQEDGDSINVSETNRMMLYYISNEFQHRRGFDVDKPMTANDLRTIVAEEQTRIDALLSIGALTYGVVRLNAQADDRSDIMKGDFSFTFDITTTPLARSLTAIVNWTDQGFVTYYANLLA